MKSFECEAFDPLANEALDGGEFFHVLVGDEREGIPCLIRAAGAADAVDIILGVLRNVVVDDMADPRDVDAASGDVGSDHDLVFSGLEAVQCFDALILGAVLVEDGNGVIIGAELLRDLVCTMLRAAENNGALEVDVIEERQEEVELPGGIDRVNGMLHDRGDRARGADFDPHGIAQGPVCQLGDFGRQSGGKEKGLPVF